MFLTLVGVGHLVKELTAVFKCIALNAAARTLAAATCRRIVMLVQTRNLHCFSDWVMCRGEGIFPLVIGPQARPVPLRACLRLFLSHSSCSAGCFFMDFTSGVMMALLRVEQVLSYTHGPLPPAALIIS
jgi:hypothetical protein